ncbi:hypothetical protein ABB37_03538 [Leptomonas pyrrhocoris]|uniref:Uncharacterized protein n=1 Tax=Leptomonas pyrrhocoris TaxID=157538 RepID=A0A0M9G5C9_LEPPY|nr:hypothetical protein ABB37_03538 [Leptomonas pyrrhocoris]KPA82479.1 hypothetical protein ABB37_03538 [Leptomonas pyrrhocoris]|eukprot:XP_015660918.1 hypothetical protein ABB37_03538 [Leptomonas pyrrhocoris]
MSLPAELEFGPHRLKLLTVSRNAEDVLDARRCSDHALTAFCYVGEMQDTSIGSSGGGTAIVWYYSPLYQFERKKIRVEESVIAAALTKAVAQHGGGGAAGLSSPSVFVDAASVASPPSSAIPSLVDVNEEVPVKKPGHRFSLPALYIRLGKSSTFREYKLVFPEPAEGSAPPKEEEAEPQCKPRAEEHHVTPRLLSPTLPRKPPLRPLSARLGSFSVRRPTLKREGRSSLMDSSSARSSPTRIHDELADVATAPQDDPLPSTVSNTKAGDVGAAGAAVDNDDDDDGAHPVVSTATAPVFSPPPQILSNVVSVVHSLSSPLCAVPESDAHKGALNGAAASSFSSGFLSTSNCLSGRLSHLQTSVMTTARSPGAESDVRPSSSNGANGTSAQCGDDIPLLLFSSFTGPETRSPSGPTPPSQRLRTQRRRPLRAHVIRAPSGHDGQRPSGPDSQGELDQVKTAPTTLMHVH